MNQQLPIVTDMHFLKGGVLSPGVLHEMLVLKNKRLASHKYCESAARLVQPLTLHPKMFYSVPVVMAGKVNDKMQISDLKGHVYTRPVFKVPFNILGFEGYDLARE